MHWSDIIRSLGPDGYIELHIGNHIVSYEGIGIASMLRTRVDHCRTEGFQFNLHDSRNIFLRPYVYVPGEDVLQMAELAARLAREPFDREACVQEKTRPIHYSPYWPDPDELASHLCTLPHVIHVLDYQLQKTSA